MMNNRFRGLWFVASLATMLAVGTTTSAQRVSPFAHAVLTGAAAQSDDGPTAALRYHGALLRRPEPGYLFDRFCGAWLAEQSNEQLERFLSDRATTGDASDKLLLAFYLTREGRRVEALGEFDATLGEFPENATAWYEKARVEAATLDFEAALRDLASARAHAEAGSDLSEKIAKLRARLLVRTGDMEGATEVLEELVASRPDDGALREDLVQLRVDEGLYDKALDAISQLIETTPDPRERVTYRLWAGEIHQRANRRDAAVDLFTQALADVGGGSWFEREVIAQIDGAYRRAGDLIGLSKKLDELCEAMPGRVEILKQRAALLAETGDVDGAIESWEQIIARTPGERQNRVALAQLLADNGRSADAITRLRDLLDQSPGDNPLRVRLAQLLAATGDGVGAVEQMREFVDRSGGGLSAVMRAVGVLERVGEAEGALAEIRRAAEANPDDSSFAEALAEVEHRIGERDRAIEIWRSMAAESRSADGAMRAGRALMGRGEHVAGFEVLRDRADDFAADVLFAQALTEAAVRADRPSEALTFALRWVGLTDDVDTGEEAVRVAARIAARSGDELSLVERLESAGDQRSEGDTCLLALLHENLGEPAKADALLATGGVRFLRQRAAILHERRDFKRATEVLEELLREPTASQMATVRDLVDMNLGAGRQDEALKWVERWKSLAPGSVMPWLRQAEIHAGASELDDAIDALVSVRRRHPDDVLVSSRLASTYAAAGRERDAERVYWDLFEASDSTASRVRWVAHLAELASWTGQSDRLIELLESRRESDRRSADPLLVLSEAYRALGEDAERRQALLEASRLEPRNIDLMLQLASVEQQAGEYERALETLRRARPLDDTGRVRVRIAEVLILDGRLAEAIEHVADDLDADAALKLSQSMTTLGEWSETARFLEGPSERLKDYRLSYVRAVALEESGQEDEAQRMFLDLLAEQEERANIAPAPAFRQQYFGNGIEGLVPGSAVELMNSLTGRYSAYAHSGNLYGGYGASGQGIVVPGTLDECHMYATAHLHTLAELLDEADRDLLASAMVDRGVVLADVLLAVPPTDYSWTALFDSDLLDEYGDNPGVLAIATLMTAVGNGGGDTELHERAAEAFDKDWPSLAILARLNVLNASPSDEHWEALRDAIERLDEPEPLAVMYLAFAAGGAVEYGDAGQLEQDQRSWVLGRVVDWFGEVDRSDPMHPMIFGYLLSGARATADTPLLASLLDAEVKAHRANPIVTASQRQQLAMYFSGYGYGTQRAITQLAMPPLEMTGLPSSVLGVLSSNEMSAMGWLHVDASEVIGELGQDADPLLQAVLAGTAGDAEAFNSILAKLIETDAASLDTYLLQAAWFGSKGEPEQAVDALSNALYLPMTRATRERLDAALIAYALETELDGQIGDLARRSALRMLYASKDPTVRNELINSFDQLGLEKEADRERDRLAAQPNIPAPSGWPSANVGSGALDRIADALDDGREDAGVRLAVRELERIANDVLSGNPWAAEQPEVKTLVDLVQLRDIEEAVLERADPGSNATASRLTRFGALLELLDHDDKARTQYEKAFEKRADASSASPLIRLRLSEGDAQGAADLLGSLRDRDLTALLQSVFVMGINNSTEQTIASAEMAAIVLETTDELNPTLAQFIPSFLTSLTQPNYNGSRSLPSLYEIEPDVGSSQEALQARRFEVHDRLVAAMMSDPLLAEAAFESRYAMSQLRGDDDQGELVTLAIEILTDLPKSTRVRQGFGSPRMFADPNASNTAEPRSAIDVVAEHTATEDPDAVAPAIVESLRSAGRQTDAQRFEGLRSLYGAREGEFPDVANEFLKGSPSQVFTGGPGPLDSVIAVMRRRDLDPLGPLTVITESVERSLGAGPAGMQIGYTTLPAYASLVFDRAGARGAHELGEALAEALIGPAEDRADIIARHSRNAQGMQMGGKVETFTMLLEQTFARDSSGVWVAAKYSPMFDPQNSSVSHRLGQRIVSAISETLAVARGDDDNPPDHAALIELVANSPFVADNNAFADFATSYSEGSTFRDLVARLRMEQHDDVRGTVLEWLNDETPTLGTILLAASIQETTDGDRFRCLCDVTDRVDALDEETRTDVLLALGGASKAPDDLDPGSQLVLTQLTGASLSALDASIEVFLSSRVSMQRGSAPWELAEQAADVITRCLEADRYEDAEGVLQHAMKEMRRSQSPTPAGGLMVRALLDEDVATPASIAMALRMELDEPSRRTATWQLSRAISTSAQSVSDERLADPALQAEGDGVSTMPDELRLRAVLLDIDALTGDADTIALVQPLARYIGRDARISEGHNIASWARAQGTERSSTFWADVEAAARTAPLSGESKALSPEDATWVVEYYVSVAERDAVPGVTRCAIVGDGLRQLSQVDVAGTRAAQAAMRLALQELEEDPAYARSAWMSPLLAAWVETDDPTGWPDIDAAIDRLVTALSRSMSNMPRSVAFASLPRSIEFSHLQPDRRPERSTGVLALELALAHQATDEADRLIKTPATELGSLTAAWAVLLRHGAVDIAADAIDRNWQQSKRSFPAHVRYDERIHENLPRLLERFDDAELRMYAEAAFAVLPDTDEAPEEDGHVHGTIPRPANDSWPDRTTRVAAVAERFGASDIADKRMRQEILTTLATTETGLDILADELAAATDARPPTSGRSHVGFSTEPEEELYLAALRADLRRGGMQRFDECMNASADRLSARDYSTTRLLENAAQVFAREVGDRLETLNDQQLEQVRTVLGELVSRPGLRSIATHPHRPMGRIVSTHAAVVLATQGSDAFDDYIEAIDTDAQPIQLDGEHLLESLGGLTRRSSHDDGSRLDILRATLTNAHVISAIQRFDRVFTTALEEELLTPDELQEHGTALAEAIGDRAWVGLALGADEADLHDLCDDAWRRAMGPLEKDRERLALIERMIECDRLALAAEFLEGFLPTNIEQRIRHDTLRKRATAPTARDGTNHTENP